MKHDPKRTDAGSLGGLTTTTFEAVDGWSRTTSPPTDRSAAVSNTPQRPYTQRQCSVRNMFVDARRWCGMYGRKEGLRKIAQEPYLREPTTPREEEAATRRGRKLTSADSTVALLCFSPTTKGHTAPRYSTIHKTIHVMTDVRPVLGIAGFDIQKKPLSGTTGEGRRMRRIVKS